MHTIAKMKSHLTEAFAEFRDNKISTEKADVYEKISRRILQSCQLQAMYNAMHRCEKNISFITENDSGSEIKKITPTERKFLINRGWRKAEIDTLQKYGPLNNLVECYRLLSDFRKALAKRNKSQLL